MSEHDKRQIWINGHPVEASREVFETYRKGDRKIRYFECDLKTGRTVLDKDGRTVRLVPAREDSLERMMEENAVQFPAVQESVEDVVFRKMDNERLHRAISQLSQEEQDLVRSLFFEERTEAAVSRKMGISQQAVHKRKAALLRKLKKYLRNF